MGVKDYMTAGLVRATLHFAVARSTDRPSDAILYLDVEIQFYGEKDRPYISLYPAGIRQWAGERPGENWEEIRADALRELATFLDTLNQEYVPVLDAFTKVPQLLAIHPGNPQDLEGDGKG